MKTRFIKVPAKDLKAHDQIVTPMGELIKVVNVLYNDFNVLLSEKSVQVSYWDSNEYKYLYYDKDEIVLRVCTTLDILKVMLSAKGIQWKMLNDMLGIRYEGHWVWHWFTHVGGELMLFSHSYSQNTGATKKGFTRAMKVYDRVLKLTGIDVTKS